MNRYSFISGDDRQFAARSTQPQDVRQFRGVDLDILARQYKIFRDMNPAPAVRPRLTDIPDMPPPAEYVEEASLIHRIFGRLATL